MPNDLSPICKAIIALLAGADKPMTFPQIRAALPDADLTAVDCDLQMLVRATVVHTATHFVSAVYWLGGSVAGRTATLDDVGATAEQQSTIRLHATSFRLDGVELVPHSGLSDPLPGTGDRRYAPVAAVLPSAPLLLERAAGHMSERATTYDSPEGERSMGSTVTAFNAITGRDLAEAEGWLLLQLLKDVRLFQRPGYHADSAEDGIAYAALKGEAKAREAANTKEGEHA